MTHLLDTSIQFDSFPSQSITIGPLAYLLVVLLVLKVLLWMWIAWRAMRAHERLADAIERHSMPADPN